MAKTKKRIVVVLGMHRSGTSAITRGLRVLGVELGNTLVPANPLDNEKGFFEDVELKDLNEKILKKLGRVWHGGLSPIDKDELLGAKIKPEKNKALKLLAKKIRHHNIFGFKDPRVAVILPFWREVFKELNLDDCYLIAIRNPASVAESLHARNGYSNEYSFLLWLKHYLGALQDSKGRKRVVVDYDRLLNSPGRQLKRISKALGLPPFKNYSEESIEFAEEFLSKNLRHHSVDISELEKNKIVPPFVCSAYFWLSKLARDTIKFENLNFNKNWKEIGKYFHEFSPVYSYFDRMEQERQGDYKKITLMRTEGDLLKKKLDGAVVEKNQALVAKDQALTEKGRVIEQRERAVGQRDEAVVEKNQALVAKDEALTEKGRVVAEREKAVAQRDEAVVEKNQALVAKDQALKELSLTLHSNSWKFTSPLRILRRKIITAPCRWLRCFLSGTARYIWRILPISLENRVVFKRWLFETFPAIFKYTATYRAWQESIKAANRFSLPDQTHLSPTPLLTKKPLSSFPVRLIAFYLPQFHPIPENDESWGKGFTEWTNVKPATKQFADHYQPREPGELGYYDLRYPEAQRRQVELAKLYGIGGFCFHFYWFGGRRLLELPVLNYLKNSDLDLPFCLCWANENWSRRWDGLEKDILIAQQHSPDDDLAFIKYVSCYLKDPRYIRIQGKPLLVVYRPGILPSAMKTAERWRRWCRENGIGEIYLAYTQSFEVVDPSQFGFDAAIEFPPNKSANPVITDQMIPPGSNFSGTVYDWNAFVKQSQKYQKPQYQLFRGVNPFWDNTARRKNKATIFLGSTPGRYGEWVENALMDTIDRLPEPSERLVFVNAWNEWAEGAYLEPDQKYGYAYLQATREALERVISYERNRRIVLVAHDANPHGAQMVALFMARMLNEDFGFHVEMVVLGDGMLLKEYARYAKIHLLSQSTDFEKEAKMLAANLYKKGFRSAIANTVVTGLFVKVLKDQNFHVVSLVHELPGVIKKLGLQSHVKSIAEHADRIVFPAKQVQEAFESFTPLPLQKAVIRAQGLYRENSLRSPGQIKNAKKDLREKFSLPDNARIVLSVGFADARKGIDLFVEAGLKALQKYPNIYFLWVGNFDPSIEAEIRKKIDASGNAGHFIFPGMDFQSDIYYAGSDIYALTSREDPFPSVILEALDTGLPVVAFEGAGGFTDLLLRGCGRMVPAFDTHAYAAALLDLIKFPDNGHLIGQKGKAIVKDEFSFRRYMFDIVAMGKSPLKRISVIIPNYNYAKYLAARINSIVQQNYPIYEIIILDDASTDESIQTLNDLIPSLKVDVKLLVNKSNSGYPCIQWLKGVEAAQGDYVWIAEADDLAEPEFLSETLQPFLGDSSIMMSYCESKQIDANGNILLNDYLDYVSDVSSDKWLKPYIEEGVNEVRNYLAIKNTVPNVSAVVFDRKALLHALREGKKEFKKYRVAGDWLIYQLILKKGKISFLPRPLNLHRRHKDGLALGNLNLSQMEEVLSLQKEIRINFRLDDKVLEKARAYSQRLYKSLDLNTPAAPEWEQHPNLSVYFEDPK